MKYIIVICKATRKPFIASNELSFVEAMLSAETIYDSWKKLSDADLAVTGVSVRVIESAYIDMIKSVSIGDPVFSGVPCVYSMGSI